MTKRKILTLKKPLSLTQEARLSQVKGSSLVSRKKYEKFIFKRKYFYENGFPASELTLIDKKIKKYEAKEFYENGKIKEEGFLMYKPETKEYIKEGEWTYYDEKGQSIKKENFNTKK